MRRLRFFLILGGGLSLLCGVALWLLWTHCGLEGCPDLRGLTEYVPDQASVVIDREGGELGQLYRVNRVVVPLDSLPPRSEEHTSELQSRGHLVCRLLLEANKAL